MPRSTQTLSSSNKQANKVQDVVHLLSPPTQTYDNIRPGHNNQSQLPQATLWPATSRFMLATSMPSSKPKCGRTLRATHSLWRLSHTAWHPCCANTDCFSAADCLPTTIYHTHITQTPMQSLQKNCTAFRPLQQLELCAAAAAAAALV
jgi:hypothetical protein